MWQNSSAHESRNCCCIIIYCCLLRYIGSCGRITVLTRAVIVVVFNYILLLGRVYWAYWLIWQNSSAHESRNCCCIFISCCLLRYIYWLMWQNYRAHENCICCCIIISCCLVRYIGSCGRITVSEGDLTPLADQLTSDLELRSDLAVQV
jgi:hypothetical protein